MGVRSNMNRSDLALFLAMLIFGTVIISSASNENKAGFGGKDGIANSLQEATINSNESVYNELLKRAWIQFSEDLNQSSHILDEFVKKNITNDDAIEATAAIYILASHTKEVVENYPSPKKYSSYQNDTISGLETLREYLWNMAKFYETDRIYYAIQARESFNRSLYYYEQTKKYR